MEQSNVVPLHARVPSRRAFLGSMVLGGVAVAASSGVFAQALGPNAAPPPAPILTPAAKLDRAKRDLVIANRILAHQAVLDAYGHVSVRHPNIPGHYLLSRSLSPGMVEMGDIMEFTLDGKPVNDSRQPYYERYIHGGIYEARPDVNIIIHGHSEATIPFGITKTPLRPVANWATEMGGTIPVWDIADKFGDSTNAMVTDMAQGRDLARVLDKNTMVLMRGHGFAMAGASIKRTVYGAIHAPKNARILLDALRLGDVKYISEGELRTRAMEPGTAGFDRGWQLWAIEAGCKDLL